MTVGTSSATAITTAADKLADAALQGIPCEPVRELLPDGSVATGYAVQNILTDAAVASGRRVVGRKVGLTSPAVQAQLGVDQPDFGVLFADMAVATDEVVAMERLLQPKIEAELAFVLAEDLDGEITVESVRNAVDHVVPALEIVDSRIRDWDITLVDTIADNASSGLYVLGDNPIDLGEQDLREIEMTMTDSSGAVISSGTGADCLGDPVLAVVWLARIAREYGSPLRAGDVVLSGALGPMVAVEPGSSFTATLSGFGSVRARFAQRTGTNHDETRTS